MISASALLLLPAMIGPAQGQAVSLTFREGVFTVRMAGETLRVPLKPPAGLDRRGRPSATSEDRVVFRKDDAFAVWDARGLTIRQGSRTYNTGLEAIALTPRLHSPEAVFETRQRAMMGIRALRATRPAGALRIESTVYFLMRWEELSGQAWLEALVSVNLDEPNAKPRLWGRFEGFTRQDLGAGQQLRFGAPGKVVAITQTADQAWGLGVHELGSETFEWSRLGVQLQDLRAVAGRLLFFIENAPHGTRLFGRLDLASGRRATLAETRGELELIDRGTPWIASVTDETGRWIANLESGARTPFPRNADARRTSAGVLVWMPGDAPKQAILMEPERWDTRARWEASSSAPRVAPRERSRTQPTRPRRPASRPPG